jgi:tetratricopeptide (TPR) repeat protein
MGRFDEAETYIRQALKGLDDPVTHFNMGLLLARTNRLDGAIAEYENALKLDPMHSDSRTNLAAGFGAPPTGSAGGGDQSV